MTYAAGQLVEPTDYNTFSNIVSYELGAGFGAAGYGQDTSSVANVSSGTTVTAAQWTNLIGKTNSILSHQSKSTITPTAVTAGNLITYYSTINDGVNRLKGNMISDSAMNDVAKANGSWVLGWVQNGNLSGVAIAYDLAGTDWKPTGGHTYGIVRTGASMTGVADLSCRNHMRVTPGYRYEVSAYAASHRCDCYVQVGWYDASGNYITEGSFGGTRMSGGTDINNWARYGGFVTAPANAYYATIWLRQGPVDSGQDSCYAWIHKPYFMPAHASQTTLSPWNDFYATNGTAIYPGAAQYSGAWGTSGNRALRLATQINFSSADQARYFFNAGGYVYVTFSRSGGSSTTRNAEWSQLATDMGAIVFASNDCYKYAGGGSTPTYGGSRGYWNGRTGDDGTFSQQLVQTDSVGSYSNNQILVRAIVNGSTSNGGYAGIYLYSDWCNYWNNPYQDAVDGTASMSLTCVYPSTTYLTSSWGTVSASFSATAF